MTILTIAAYNSCRTCLSDHMRSISCHIMPLVINSLGVDTHTHTYRLPGKSNFKKPGTHWLNQSLHSKIMHLPALTNLFNVIYNNNWVQHKY